MPIDVEMTPYGELSDEEYDSNHGIEGVDRVEEEVTEMNIPDDLEVDN